MANMRSGPLSYTIGGPISPYACERGVNMLDPLVSAENARRTVSPVLDPDRRSTLGQFFTPPATARFMASLANLRCESIRFLDPGAGAGGLTAAWVAEICSQAHR